MLSHIEGLEVSITVSVWISEKMTAIHYLIGFKEEILDNMDSDRKMDGSQQTCWV